LTFADVSYHPGATRADLSTGRLEDILAPPRNHDRRAAAGELGGGCLAEVRASSRDERDAAAEKVVGEDARGLRLYSPMTLITSRFDRWPSNSQ
jgi:hypothetical protein